MTAITILLYVMIFIISLLLIALILIQPSKSGGMGAAFGGVGESAFGGKAGSHLTKTTVVMTAIFFVFALLLAMFIGHGLGGKKEGYRKHMTETVEKSSEVEAPAEKAAVKAEAAAKPAEAKKVDKAAAEPAAETKVK